MLTAVDVLGYDRPAALRSKGRGFVGLVVPGVLGVALLGGLLAVLGFSAPLIAAYSATTMILGRDN